MMSPGGKLTALACYQTKRVNKVEEITYISTNIGRVCHSKTLQLIAPPFDKLQSKSFIVCAYGMINSAFCLIRSTFLNIGFQLENVLRLYF